MAEKVYKLKSEMWLYPGATAAWHFITVPKKESEEIKKKYAGLKKGFGSVPVRATIGKTTWTTSIFPDKKAGAYLLPVKADVRRKEHLLRGDIVSLAIEI